MDFEIWYKELVEGLKKQLPHLEESQIPAAEHWSLYEDDRSLYGHTPHYDCFYIGQVIISNTQFIQLFYIESKKLWNIIMCEIFEGMEKIRKIKVYWAPFGTLEET